MRLKLLISTTAILGILVVWQLMQRGAEPVDNLHAIDARMEKLRLAGDVETLSAETENTDIPTARQAVEALGHLGAKAVPKLRRALQDKRPEVRQQAARAYARAADPKQAAPILAKIATTDKSPAVRASAITGLGHRRTYEAMDTLLAEMNDDDVVVRGRAAEAVVTILGPRYPYDPHDPPAKRLEIIAKIRKFWLRAKSDVRNYFDKRRREAKTAQK